MVGARRERLIVTSWNVNEDEIWLVDPVVTQLPSTSAPGHIAAAVESALARSKATTRSATDPTILEPVLEAAEVRSWGEYVRSLRSVVIREENGTTTVTSQRNLGARDGLKEQPEDAKRLHGPDADELGRVIRALLEL
jgi:hypothetical protein